MSAKFLVSIVSVALLASACAETAGSSFIGANDSSAVDSSFALAVPTAEQVALRVPAPEANALTVGEPARYYLMTYEVTRNINGTVYGILSVIGDLVNYPPTTYGDDWAVWGPFTPALSPNSFMLVVERETDELYNYGVFLRPRASASDEDFVMVLGGQSQPSDTRYRGTGQFTLDWSALSSLDPLEHNEGLMHVEYHHQDLQWRSVDVMFSEFYDADDDEAVPTDALYRYLENGDTSGDFQFAYESDVHGDGARDEKELVQVRSRWSAGGAGRADVIIASPEIQADLWDYVGIDQSYVELSECWNDGFERIYYEESPVTLTDEDGQGEPFDCVYLDSLFTEHDVVVLH